MKRQYIVTELRQETLESVCVEIKHYYDTPEDMIWYADYLAAVAQKDLEAHKIVWFQIMY